MASSENNKQKNALNKTLVTGGAALAGAIASKAHAMGTGKIKVGLLGCGGRGNGAIRQNLNADPGIEVVDDPGLMVDGGDPQLDKAIEVMLDEIEKNPFVPAPKPAYPDRSGMGIRPEDK